MHLNPIKYDSKFFCNNLIFQKLWLMINKFWLATNRVDFPKQHCGRMSKSYGQKHMCIGEVSQMSYSLRCSAFKHTHSMMLRFLFVYVNVQRFRYCCFVRKKNNCYFPNMLINVILGSESILQIFHFCGSNFGNVANRTEINVYFSYFIIRLYVFQLCSS